MGKTDLTAAKSDFRSNSGRTSHHVGFVPNRRHTSWRIAKERPPTEAAFRHVADDSMSGARGFASFRGTVLQSKLYLAVINIIQTTSGQQPTVQLEGGSWSP